MSQAGEDRLKRAIRPVLEEHFKVYPEEKGTHQPDGIRVRIDYILKAKPHLLETGFTDGPIGLEVKEPETDGGFPSKAIQVTSQAIDYSHTIFDNFGQCVFVLVYPSLEKQIGTSWEGYVAAFRILDGLAQKSHVGSLKTYGRNGEKVVEMAFQGGTYWRNTEGLKGFKSIAERRWVGSHGRSVKFKVPEH